MRKQVTHVEWFLKVIAWITDKSLTKVNVCFKNIQLSVSCLWKLLFLLLLPVMMIFLPRVKEGKLVKSLNCPKIVFLKVLVTSQQGREKHSKLKSCHTNITNYFRERNYMFVASFFLFVLLNFLHEKVFLRVSQFPIKKHDKLAVRKKFLILTWT